MDAVKSCASCKWNPGSSHFCEYPGDCVAWSKWEEGPEERDLTPITCETCALSDGLECLSFRTCNDGDMWQPEPQTDKPAPLSFCADCGGPYSNFHDCACGACAPQPVKSDGGSSSYYAIPEGAKDLQDLIERKEMSFARGNLFKALYRLGEKDGIDHEYDLNKCQWFLDRLKKMHADGRRL